MRTLLIDNYDSFTYNLYQLLAEVNGVEPVVVRNDEATWEELSAAGFESVVISPGPGRPERERDFGVCAEALRSGLPLLGVCLGLQGLGWVNGGQVVPAPQPLHGLLRPVEHTGSPLFAGIPTRFEAVHYHSLCLARPLPACLEEIASSEEGVPMAVAHRTLPQWGVQFHPESVAAEHGERLLANFRDLAGGAKPRGSFRTRGAKKEPRGEGSGLHGSFSAPEVQKEPRDGDGATELRLVTRRLGGACDAERAFEALYADSADAFWLDSSTVGDGARFSFMGDASGPLGATISYDVEAGEVTVCRSGETEVRREPVLSYLDRELARLRAATGGLEAGLPFGFDCGFAGYLGYEVKADCGGTAPHRSPHPDAAVVFADRLIAFDHELDETHLLCLAGGGAEAEAWLEATAQRLHDLPAGAGPGEPYPRPTGDPLGGEDPVLRLARPPERYLEEIEACKRQLAEGESYELCLTNAVVGEVDIDPLRLYAQLRRVNPAPFASYLRFGDLAVLSSSPERFLRVGRDGTAEARPIKGTSRRDADPAEDERLARRLREDEKNRAENLMIVDLLRNDLGAVCEVGSVEVPALMEVESFETVHQLVSTVRGRLRQGATAAECVHACFPPGSMTGAPKLRTVEILDRIEGAARGVYSGTIGYFGLGGACDLSVTIRTIVLAEGRASIGTGGAIVMQSVAQNELEEALLKARAPAAAVVAIATS
ncbi:MAG TPA: aminodeoxychorismate synthase component I [Solirubrobacterales bacterium]|nr:aminodeoxychorismate synthase component I [Solirubrobacterales bacterium]